MSAEIDGVEIRMWAQRAVSEIDAVEDDPEHAHGLEDEMLATFVRHVAAHREVPRGIRDAARTIAAKLDDPERSRWYA